MELKEGLETLSIILKELVPDSERGLAVRPDPSRKYTGPYRERYRIDSDKGIQIDADHVIYNLCTALYDHTSVWGDGEISWPNSRHEEYRRARVSDAVLMPIAPQDESSLETLVHWSTLYSPMTVFILPQEIRSLDISYSGASGSRSSWDVVERLLRLNKAYEDVIHAGRGVFLPSLTSHGFTSLSSYSRDTYSAPIEQPADDIRYIPLNVLQALQGRNLEQDLVIYRVISVPYYRGIILPELVKLAESETDAFTKFNHFLNKKLEKLGKARTTLQIEDCFHEIDNEIANLRIEAEKITKLRSLQGIQLATFVLAFSVLVSFDSPIAKSIAGVLGSVNFIQLLKDYVSYQRERIALKKSDVYFAYILQEGGEANSRRLASWVRRLTSVRRHHTKPRGGSR